MKNEYYSNIYIHIYRIKLFYKMSKQNIGTFSRHHAYKKPWKKIGSGAYGKVYSAINHHTGDKVAIKEIFDLRDTTDSIKLIRELQILKHFSKYKHPNIIKLNDAYIIQGSKKCKFYSAISKYDYEKVYIITDFLDTDLHKVIHRHNRDTNNNALTERHYEYFLAQLVSGLYYLFTAGIIHRDLKPSNIVLNSDCSLKIIDFGLSISEDDKYGIHNKAKSDYVVTRWYRAPEVILYNKEKQYDYQIDIWSLGCIIAEIILKRPLFDGEDSRDQMKKILKFIELSESDFEYLKSLNGKDSTIQFINKYKMAKSDQTFAERFRQLHSVYYKQDNGQDKEPGEISSKLLELIEKMLIINPNERITIEELIKDPYFEGIFKFPESETGYINIISCSKKFTLDYNFETCLLESDNINDIKKYIYNEVYDSSDDNSDDIIDELSQEVKKQTL